MEALVAKAVERLGRRKVWLVVRAVRCLPVEKCNISGVREELRRLHLYLDDDHFTTLAQQFTPSHNPHTNTSRNNNNNNSDDSTTFDTSAFIQAFLSILPPRRQHVISLVLRKCDPDATGVISFLTLQAMYDVMRHPRALTQQDPQELIQEFLTDFEEARGEGNITTEELAAYYVGISYTTPRDADFELRCIRSFSLDRPKRSLEEEEISESHAGTRRSRSFGIGPCVKHPLYQTSAMEYGKECEKVAYNGKFSRNHCFTKYAPMQRSGGATSMNM